MTTSGYTGDPSRDELTPAGFSALLSAVADAIIIIDRQGAILNFNQAAETLFQHSARDVIGKNVKVLMPDPYRAGHDEYIENYVETGKAQIIGIGRRVVAQRSDQTQFPIELSVGEYRTGDARYFIGIIRDLSEQERLVRELQESREDLQKREQALDVTLKNAPIGILTADLDGQVMSVNHAATRLIGYRENELVEHSWSDFIHAEDVDTIDAMRAQLVEGRKPSVSEEIRMVNASGRVINVVMHCGCVRDAEGRPESLVAQLVDVTEQIRAEREAVQIRERFAHVDRISTMGEMASGIAHEINQPLSAISSYVQACLKRLETGDVDIERLHQILEKADAQAQRAGDIVRRVRSLIRNQERVRERIDLCETIADALQLANADARARGFSLEFSDDCGNCTVIADRVQIQQVVLNLVRNAIDALEEIQASPAEVKIRLQQDASQGQAVVSVTDRGNGVPEDISDELFDSFVTAKSSGTGLGLSISRTIVEAHGGVIWFERLSPGTRFQFSIPLAGRNP